MALTVDNIAGYVSQNRGVQFMKEGDYSTAKQDDAKRIHEFLSNKSVREARQRELADYLLGMKDENGKALFTQKEAEKAASYQVESEMSQKQAQVTVVFIDKEKYEAALAEAKKNGTEGLYDYKLIEDKELLSYINGDKARTLEEKEAHYKKFFKTDDKGNLAKDEKGNYIFDSDKFKTEFGKDSGIDNKLQLSERECAANRRKIKTATEKNAIKAMGLDYRRDNTGLYRTLAGAAALAALVFGGASAAAEAVGVSGSAVAVAQASAATRVGGLIGALAAGGVIPFIHDKDGRFAKKRNEAVEQFVQKPEPVQIKLEPAQIKLEEPKLPEYEIKIDQPCYTVEGGVPVKTIRYGGYWHYANLYNDCATNKPLTRAQINELTQLLKPGHDESSIQKGDTNATKVLQPIITLKDGTQVCLVDEEEQARRVAKMHTQSGGANMKLNQQKLNVRTCDGTHIGTASNQVDAHRQGIEYQQQHTTYRVVKKSN